MSNVGTPFIGYNATHPQNQAPDDAVCVTCLGFGTEMKVQGADNGRRQRVTVTCRDCNGKKLRAIPMVDLA